MDDTTLRLLAHWGEQETANTARLIDAVVGAVLHKMGETTITISKGDFADLGEQFEIVRTALPDGSWRITLRPKDTGEPELPL